MDQGTNEKCVGGNCGHMCCAGGYCGWHKGGHSWIVRILLGLAILAIVFKLGFELGEFKGEFVGGRTFRAPYGTMMNYGYGNGMMQGGAAYDSLTDFGF